MSGTDRPDTGRRRQWSLPADLLLLALIYFCTARLALLLAFEHTNASPFWPPAGIACAALALLGPRALIGILIGASAANAVTFLGNGQTEPLRLAALSLLIGLGNTLGAAAGWWVAGRPRIGAGWSFGPVAALRLLAAAAVAGLAAGVVGASTVVAGTGLPAALWPLILRIWAVGDAIGIVVLTPLLLAWWSAERPEARRSGPVYLAFALAVGVVVAVPAVDAALPLLLALPLLALPTRSRRTLWTVALLAVVVVIWRTITGHGPFAGADSMQGLLRVQWALCFPALLLLLDGVLLRGPLRGDDARDADVVPSGADSSAPRVAPACTPGVRHRPWHAAGRVQGRVGNRGQRSPGGAARHRKDAARHLA